MCVPVSVFRLKPVVRERHLLSQLLFQIAPIRSDTGKKALELLVELYRKETETSVRPGLDRHHCKHRTSPRNETHAYRCCKKHLAAASGFAEFYFLCNEWFLEDYAWKQHCNDHLTHRDVPLDMHWVRLNGSVLPGMYPECLGDSSLSPLERFRQFIDLQEWETHILNHEDNKQRDVLTCTHPRCKGQKFDSKTSWEYHRQDVHRIFTRKLRKRKRTEGCGSDTAKNGEELEIVVDTSWYFPPTKRPRGGQKA
ncbi:hypothetical protein CCHR01_08037 [Colletotrichum chrysophilum]|uniref:Uncharacterized protein n=1 Tax=Colletotrichum chrysophilum TaxID=1836956 RepID=A0AAD9EI93_9PEZI|nr:hypothetical protein CCHR01_08037 [Colletotrichum chrysophilum]